VSVLSCEKDQILTNVLLFTSLSSLLLNGCPLPVGPFTGSMEDSESGDSCGKLGEEGVEKLNER